MKRNLKNFIKVFTNNKIAIFIIYILIALIASYQDLTAGLKTFFEGGHQYCHYNNYIIFKQSFFHLLENNNLYVLYPEEHWDLYKYTPSFTVFFGFFAILPDELGLVLWNLLNTSVLLFSIYYLPKLNTTQKGLILLLCIPTLIVSIQNEQSNALIAGLLIFGFGLLENKKQFLGIFLIVFTVFIKLFGLVGFSLFIFYGNKWRLFIYIVLSVIIIGALPLLFISLNEFESILYSYLSLLKHDFSESNGYSLMGMLNSWFDLKIDKLLALVIGISIFLLPFLKFRINYKFRLLTLASILTWVIIFNHKAESPTLIIAVIGCLIWYFYSSKSIYNKILLVSLIVLTELSSTDLFPYIIRENYLEPYIIKVLPCVIIWAKIVFDLLNSKESTVVNNK